MSDLPEDAVGRRVSCGGERATVRFVGPVPPTTGLWLGVEWDNPDRGKHDGSHEGVSYFTCRHPTGGSFVRPVKASFGVDYLAAVRQVYEMDTEDVLSEDVSSSSSKRIKWFIKERSFQSLTSVLLGGREVNGCGADGEIRKTTPNVEWLDLSGTLLSCWEDVSSITEQLVRLEGLQLSSNRLTLPSDCLAHRHAFCSLKVLVLNSSQLTWPQVCTRHPSIISLDVFLYFFFCLFVLQLKNVWYRAHQHVGDLPPISHLSPIWGNVCFKAGRADGGFRTWAHKGVQKVADLYKDGSLLTFDQVCQTYDIPKKHFLKIFTSKTFHHVKIQTH
uniref:Tubulin-specific chaperone E n=1 Tax=Acanthochromis polyacanthus TaxID=80966 RepID=A0A3Q1EDZ2_9TELE